MAYSLLINGTQIFVGPVDEPSPPADRPVSIEAFEASYDSPASVRFRVDRDWRPAGWSADSVVILQRDGNVIFEGLLDLPEPRLSTRAPPSVGYTAYDRSNVRRPATSSNGITAIALAPGTLQAVVAQYIGHIGPTLTDMGISTTVLYSGGAEAIVVLPVSLNDKTITEGFRIIAENAPGVRVLLDPNGGSPAFRFVNLNNSPLTDIAIDVTRIPELNVRQTLEGRCGAVRTTQRTVPASGSLQISGLMTLAWDTSLEANWTLADAHSAIESGVETAASAVYRRWSFNGFAGAVSQEAEVTALMQLPGFIPEKYARVPIQSVDWKTKIVTLKYPSLKVYVKKVSQPFGPAIKGKAKAAKTRLSYTVGGSGSVTVPGTRFPATGFAGRAFALAPISMAFEQQVDVPAGVDHAAYAQQAFAALSELLVEGVVEINSEPPAALLTLDQRINLTTASHGLTGFEAINAPLNGIRVTFEGGIQAELDFSTDRSGLLRGGLG